MMKWYLFIPAFVKHLASQTFRLGLVLLLAGGCGLRFGGGHAVSWFLTPVEGAVVEPGLREQLQSDMRRQLQLRRIGEGQQPLEIVIEYLEHRRSLSDVGAQDAAWRSELAVRLSMPSRPDCMVQVKVERVWFAEGHDPHGASLNRIHAVENLAKLASSRGLDRLLGKPSCR